MKFENLFLLKKNRKIDIVDVELLVKPKIEIEIFKTIIDAVAARNKKEAFYRIRKYLEKGESPLYLLSMINFQFRNILTVKDFIEKNKPYQVILKQTKLHPFVVKKSYFQAQKFTIQELKKIYQKIFQVDLDIKTGKIEPETALDLLVAEI
jgi:DNA polymerase-3 subunit delta